MGLDLPSCAWALPLVGPWWPWPPTALRAGAQQWQQAYVQQEHYAQSLQALRTVLAGRNQGHTADDLAFRYYEGERYHLDLAEKYLHKSNALNTCADIIDYVRSRLEGIAQRGSQQINDILASQKPLEAKMAAILDVQRDCNTEAESASQAAVNDIMKATHGILQNEGINEDARSWARDHGFNFDDTPKPRPMSDSDLSSAPLGSAGRAGAGDGHVSGPVATQSPPATLSAGGHSSGGDGGNAFSHGSSPTGLGRGGFSSGGPGPHGSPAPVAPGASALVTGGPRPTAPGMPGVPNAPTAPATVGGQGLSPGLGQSFANGMTTGQPAAAGAQSLSEGAANAMGQQAAPPPAAAPTAPPVVPAAPVVGGIESAATAPDASSTAHAAPVAPAGGVTPVAPVMTTGTWSAPAAPAGPVVPSGPLPAYGSDLRPPVAAPPAMPSVPSGTVSGAPVAPSAASSPSAGGPLVSPVERAAPGSAAGQAGASSSTMAGASAASAAAGGTAGAVATRAAEQQRLQRLVDAVARQEPRLSWAAGLREDGITSLLVTDLAGGWIPPHVRLPANVTLLEPAARRRDAGVVDLLGAIVVAAAHHPNAYVAEAAADAPALTGDRTARSAAPAVDELGPTLVDAVRRRDGLPRIAQALATPAVRKTGVLDNEVEVLRERVIEIQHAVLNAYPNHDAAGVGDWMLLAAIEALIEGHEYLANYHLAWFTVTNRHGGS